MTTKKIQTSTALYASLYSDYVAQCDAAYLEGMTRAERNEALDTVKREFSKDPKYKLLAENKFAQPTTPTRHVSKATLDSMVQNHGF